MAHSDPAKGETAYGLIRQDFSLYVGFADAGKIVEIGIPDGTAFSDYASIPLNGAGRLYGLMNTAQGILAAVGDAPAMAMPPVNGIYKVTGPGSFATPYATDPNMNAPRALDGSGELTLVADASGVLFRVEHGTGKVTEWLKHPMLDGTDTTCKHAAPYPLGANGILMGGNSVFVSNANLGQIVEIPIQMAPGDLVGTAGAPKIIAGPDCDALGGVGALAADFGTNDIVAVVTTQNKLVRVHYDTGMVEVLYAGAPLDGPAGINVGTPLSKAVAYMTNSALGSKSPSPGVLSMPFPVEP
jgi:hypothetical protein